MNNILLTASIFLISIAGFGQGTKTVKAFFVDYDTDSEIYSFEETNGEYISFNAATAEVLKSTPLKSNKMSGKAYLITYSTKVTTDEDEDEFEELTITKLQEIKLERDLDVDEE